MAKKKVTKKVAKKNVTKKKVTKKQTKKVAKKQTKATPTKKKKSKGKQGTSRPKNFDAMSLADPVKPKSSYADVIANKIKNKTKGKGEELTPIEETFCQIYTTNGFRGGLAAIKAGYGVEGAYVTASRLLSNPKIVGRVSEIAGEIIDPEKEKVRSIIRKVEELLDVSIDDVFEEITETDETGHTYRYRRMKSFEEIKKLGNGIKAIRSIKPGKYGDVVELVSQENLLKLLSDLNGLIKNALEISGPNGGAIPVRTLNDFYNPEAIKGDDVK